MIAPEASTGAAVPPAEAKAPVLEVVNLQKRFEIKRGIFSRIEGHVHAVDGISFAVEQGEEYFVLALKIGVEGAAREARRRGDPLDRGGIESVPHEDPLGGVDEFRARHLPAFDPREPFRIHIQQCI